MPEATGPLALDRAPNFRVVGVLHRQLVSAEQSWIVISLHRLKKRPGPHVQCNFCCCPSELGATEEIAKPDKEWVDLQAWTLPPAAQSLDARRVEFDRCESTLLKAESDLGFDASMAAMRPADVLRTTAHIAEESSGYPFSDPGGRVDFTQILSQLVLAAKNLQMHALLT